MKLWIVILVAAFLSSFGTAKALDGTFYMPPQVGWNTGTGGWDSALSTVYFNDGAAWNRLNGSEATATATLTLSSTLPAGTYYLWVRGASIKSPTAIPAVFNIAVGGSNLAGATWTHITWSKLTITPVTSFSTIDFTFFRQGGSGGGITHDYYVNGFYLTTNTGERLPTAAVPPANAGSRFFDYSAAAVTNNADFVTRNLLPNSSFELGITHGWTWSRDAEAIADYNSAALSTEQARTGTKSFKIQTNAGRYSMYAPLVRIRNDKVKRNYVLSFYARTDVGTQTITTLIGHLIPNALEDTTQADTATTAWTRFTKTVALSSLPTPEIVFNVEHVDGTKAVYIDDVQFEEGTTATAYAPAAPVEFSLTTDKLFNAFTSPPTVSLTTYNTTGSASRTANVNLYDWMENLVGTTNMNLTCATGVQANVVSLSGWRSGTHRITARLSDDPIGDELVASVVPTVTATSDTTQLIGTHTNFKTSHSAMSLGLGLTWNRSLSPAKIFRWDSIELTDDVFTWTTPDTKVNAVVAGGQTILGSLLTNVGGPSFAMSGGTPNTPNLTQLDVYVQAVVNRYKDRITWWEDWNEPNQFSAAQYAPILTTIANAVKTADPTSKFVAFGGVDSSTWANDIWALLTPTTKGQIDVVSTHRYPASQANDFMKAGTDTKITTWAALGVTFGKPVWNTESGTWNIGVQKGDQVGQLTDGKHPYDYWDYEPLARGNWAALEQTGHSMARSLGRGFGRFFYYDGRIQDYLIRSADTQPTMWEPTDAIKPDGASVLWMQKFLTGKSQYAVLSNAGSTTTEGYEFTGGGESVIICFNQPKLSKLFACVKTSVTQYDSQGNVITPQATGFAIGRTHTYWVSTALTAAQLKTLWEGAAVSTLADTTAPSVTVESSPHMLLYGDQTHVLLRWVPVDNNDIPTDSVPTAVQTRSRIVGQSSTWSAWGTTNYRYATGLTNANTYHLEVEAKDLAGNVGTVSGPDFGLSTGVDTTPPSLTSAAIGAGGTTLVLNFNEATIRNSVSPTITLSGGATTTVTFTGSGTTTHTYGLDRVVYGGETGTIAATLPANAWEDAAGNDVSTFSSFAITNGSVQALPGQTHANNSLIIPSRGKR